MYSLVVIAVLSIVEANQEFTCKPKPGCHFARCSPLWPITEPALRERNEFPINCVKNGTDPKDEDQDMVLKSHKQMISELTDKLTEANETIKELEKHSDETSKVMASQTKTISKLTDDMVNANLKIEMLMKGFEEGYQILLNHSNMYAQVLFAGLTEVSRRIEELEEDPALKTLNQTVGFVSMALTAAFHRIGELEEKPEYCQLRYAGKCFWFEWFKSLLKFDQGAALCKIHGGRVANVYSGRHYYLLLDSLRMFAFRYGFIDFWTGLKYNSATNSVTLSDGSPAPFVKWHPGYPARFAGQHINIKVKDDSSFEDQHMVNTEPYVFGAICEY